ncbi:unnamed protein product [Ectocarpus sp. 6 AP-2014]
MVIRGDTSNAVKDLLRSMLHAWYDLTREEAGAWTNHLEAEAALQHEMRQPEQVTKLVCGILFHAWRQHVINPLVRERRKNRPESKSAWVQRMMAPKTKAARGGGNSGGGRLDETSGGEADCNVASNSEQEVIVGVWRSSSLERSSRQRRQGHHPLGSRYLRVQTTSPENIRYGRSPAAPASPSPVPPPAAARRSTGAATAPRRSWRSRRRPRQQTEPATIGSNGALRCDHGQLCCVAPDRSSVAADGSFVPDVSVCSGGCWPGSSSGNVASAPRLPGPGGRRQKDVLAGDSQVFGKKDKLFENVASAGPVNDSQERGESSENVDTEGDDDGWRGAAFSYLGRCSPPLTWDELEPWEQRNPRVEWMLTSRGMGGGEGRWGDKNSGVVVPKGVPVVPDGEVLRRVAARLDQFNITDHRQQRAAALLLLLRGEKQSGDGRAYDARCGGTAMPPDAPVKIGLATACSASGCCMPFQADRSGKIKPRRGRSGCRNIAENGRGVRGATNLSKGSSSNVQTRVSDGGAHGALPSRSVVDGVGRDIARVRKGRVTINNRDLCGKTSSPALVVPHEAREVMFGFGSRLGRHSDREDRWI